MCRCVEAGQRILSHQASDNRDIGRARNLRPALSVHTRAVNESCKDELARLALRCASETSNNNGNRSKGVLEHRDVVEVLEGAYAEGIDETLCEEYGSVDADSLAGRGYIVRPKRRCGRDEVGAAETGSRGKSIWRIDTRRDCEAHLIPVVTATWPSKLNQPVIQDMIAADRGVDNIAAQK